MRESSRARPPRRWRDGASIQARTREQSSDRVRVPPRQKAPRSSQRCRPSRGGIRQGPRPGRRNARDSRPHDESNRRPGCSRRYEQGTREIVEDRAYVLARGPRPTVCLVHASGTRRAKARAYRPWLAGSRCGNAPGNQRSWTSVGASEQRGESPTRVRGSNARRVCPRVDEWLQKSASNAEAQRSATPAGNGARGRGPGLRGLERAGGGEKASIVRVAVAKPLGRRSPKPGVRKGVAGQRSLFDGRHLGSLRQRASFTRARGG